MLYVEDSYLLIILLVILIYEKECAFRLEVQALPGSLDAVGPDHHKYHALSIYFMGACSHFTAAERSAKVKVAHCADPNIMNVVGRIGWPTGREGQTMDLFGD